MAEALLGIVIEKLGSFAQDELATFWGFDQHTQKLSSNLKAIHAFLKDAERKQITSHAVKDWLQKLTDAAYVLEDILDECSIHSKTVQCYGKNSFIARFHPKDILFHCHIGKRMKDIDQRFRYIREERSMFELCVGVTENQGEGDDEWRQTSSVITESEVYGRDEDRELIVKFLLQHASNNEDLSIYPIVGMAGLGKTTLAKEVFNDDAVRNYFDLRIWICVSNDFVVEKILQSIIESITGQNPNLKTLQAKHKRVLDVLQSKRYLLVLDDVWNEDQEKWKELKGMLKCASATKGASVLVTTRLEQVANIMEPRPAHRLKELSEEDSWSLFKHHAFGLNRGESAELVVIGKEIVRKCVGSPLAIKTLGSLLRDESEVTQWQNVRESNFWDVQEESSIMRALKLSYFNLELSLRRCFSFCAIFPKGSEIVKEELIHLWMANGFIKSKGNVEVEDVGNKICKKLYQRSFFQEAKSDEFGVITSLKMHDLFHDLAQSIMGEECVVYGPKRLTHLSSRVHHLHLLKSNESVNKVAFKKVESLRTFLGFNSDTFGENFRCLPSKSLRALGTNSFQLSSLIDLTHLRYLNMCGSWVTSLPNSICGLQKLQILKLEDCKNLYSLPKQLTRLQDLRHLMINRCYSIVEMPPKIGKLSHLRTLSTFIVCSKPGYGLAELHGLKLGGKLHIRSLENVPSEWDAKQADLISKEDLNFLYLSWGCSGNSEGTNVNAEKVLEALEPPSTLESFGMKGYQGIQLPNWLRNLSVLKDLVEVILYECGNCEQLPPFGKLPHLKGLFISGMKNVKHIDGESYDGVQEKAFPSSEKFTAQKLPNLERILRDEGVEMLPRLSQLIINGVPNLQLPRLPSVEHVEASDIEDADSFMEGVVGNMLCLKTLKIESFDKLKVLTDQLGKLGALQELVIRHCDELESFPEHVLQGLTSLQTLCISNCKKLKSLSQGVKHLSCLERLNISYCPELVALPSNMNQLTTLRDVSINCSILPEGLQHIPSLKRLVIIGCKCTSLPDWLGDMTSLRQLEVSGCTELRSLPSSFQCLINLNVLCIYKCPELKNRCKRVTGEDWQYIDHIPLVLSFPEKETVCESMRSAWKFSKFCTQFAINALQYGYTEGDEFDSMVDGPSVANSFLFNSCYVSFFSFCF